MNTLHDEAGILKLDIRARFNVLKLMHHEVYYLGEEVIYDYVTGQIHTRSADAPILKVPFPKTSNFRNSYMYSSHILWNSLPVQLMLISDPLSFKREFKKFLLQYN